MKISAAQVKELREKTGAGMMACKEALAETGGDLPAAEVILQKKGLDRADNRAERETLEGVIAVRVRAEDGFRGALLLQVFCETDFVARNEEFIAFAQDVLESVITSGFQLRPELYEEKRALLSAQMGENIRVGELGGVSCSEPVVVGTYLHSDRRIGAAVALGEKDAYYIKDDRVDEIKEIARDIAMHAVAMKPLYQVEKLITGAERAAQRDIFEAQVRESGKPEKLWDRIVEGKMGKWVAAQCLMTQPFVKDPSLTVGEYLKEKGVEFRGCSWRGLTAV